MINNMNRYHQSAACAFMALSALNASAAGIQKPSDVSVGVPVAAAVADDTEFFLDSNNLSAEFGWMFDMGTGLSVDNLYGGNLSFGYSFKETARSFQSAYLKIGYFAGSQKEHVSSLIDRGGDFDTSTYPGDYKFSQRIIPVIFGWDYHYKISSSVNVFAGLQAGFYFSQTRRKMDVVSDTNHVHSNNTANSFVSPMVGANIGITYRFAPKWEWSAGMNFNQVFNMAQEQVTSSSILKKSTMTGVVYTGITYTY